MGIPLCLSTVDVAKVGQNQRVEPGLVHVQVIDAVEFGGHNGGHKVKLQILAHTDSSQVGKTYSETLSLDQSFSMEILIGFLIAAGVVTREQLIAEQEAAKARGADPVVNVDLMATIGRQLFGTMKPSKKGDYINFNYPLRIDDPAADRHPRDAGMLAKALGTVQSTPVMPPVQVAQQTQQAPAKVDPFARLAK